MTPTITHIHTIPYRLPLHEPLAWGKASVLVDAHHVLLRVTLSDGAEGWAEAPPRPTIYGETVESICAIVSQELAPRLLGEALDDATLPKLTARMAQIANNQTARGSLDIALHDALAMSRGVPLAEHLGVVQERIRDARIPDALLHHAQMLGQGHTPAHCQRVVEGDVQAAPRGLVVGDLGHARREFGQGRVVQRLPQQPGSQFLAYNRADALDGLPVNRGAWGRFGPALCAVAERHPQQHVMGIDEYAGLAPGQRFVQRQAIGDGVDVGDGWGHWRSS